MVELVHFGTWVCIFSQQVSGTVVYSQLSLDSAAVAKYNKISLEYGSQTENESIVNRNCITRLILYNASCTLMICFIYFSRYSVSLQSWKVSKAVYILIYDISYICTYIDIGIIFTRTVVTLPVNNLPTCYLVARFHADWLATYLYWTAMEVGHDIECIALSEMW